MKRSIYRILEVIHFIFFSQANDNVFQLQKPLLYTETLAEPVKIPQTTRKIILKIGFLF